MKKKKIIIIISIILFIIVVTSILFVLLNKKELNEKPSKNNEIIKEEKIDKEEIDKEKEEEETFKEEKEPTVESTNPVTESKPTNNNNQNNTQRPNNNNTNNNNNNNGGNAPSTPATPPPAAPQPVYSCPSGYNLSGTQCISTTEAYLDCPNGLTSFSDGTVSGCINLSEIYTPTGDSCQPGEGTLTQMQIGGPSTKTCVPIRGQKVYMCPSGYSLSGTTCTSVIAATVTQGRKKSNNKKIIRM